MTKIRQPRFKMGAILSRVHRFIYVLLNGRFVSRRGSAQFLLLTTEGRRSHRMKTVPLLYLMHPRSPSVIASKGGSPKAPDWLLNIRAEPKVRVQIGGVRQDGTARIASDEEREELWPRFLECYSGYAAYQARTSRRFPIVIITPAED